MIHLFIVNPAAGKGSTMKFIPEIKKLFEHNGEKYKIEITKCPGDAEKISQRYIEDVKDENLRIYSVGGDGTLNEVLNGVVGSSCSIAVIPSGTGNDFIKSIVPKYNIKTILKNTIDGEEKYIDCAKVNDRYFLNISSIGLDADVIGNSLKYRKWFFLRGKMVYIFSIMATLFKYKCKHIQIELDKKIYDLKILLIAIANGKCYGGGFVVSPYSKLDDGKLNINFIREMKVRRLIRYIPKFASGQYEDVKEVSFLTGKKVKIKCDDNLFMNVDGEVYKTKEADFEIIPNVIKFVIPKMQSETL